MPDGLRDIRGLDPISWWPPAQGWWIALALGLVLLAGLVLWLRHLQRYPPGSWRQEARRALRELQRRQHQLTVKERAGRLSELLRRIAIARFGRERLASLAGEEWIQWLHQADPNGFDWQSQGRLLLRLPYAPQEGAEESQQLDRLVAAALDMVRTSREDAGRAQRRWTIPQSWRGGWRV